MMNPFALAGLLACVSALGFGIYVFSKVPTRRLHQVWLAFSFSVAMWGAGSVWIALEQDPERALWAWRLSFAFGVVWIPVLFLHFVLKFSRVVRRGLLPLAYALGCGMALLALLSPHFFQNVRQAFPSIYFPVPGPIFFPWFLVLWCTGVVYNHVLLIQEFSASDPLKREQIRYFFLATALGFTGGSLTYLPILGVDVYPWGHFAISVYPVVMAYAIARYRLMDITMIMEKGLSFLVVVLLSAVPVGAVVLWGQRRYFGEINLSFSVLLLMVMAGIGIGSYVLILQAERAVGRTLFKKRHEMYDTMSKFSQVVISILNCQTLAETITDTLVREMNITHATLYAWEKDKNLFLSRATHGQVPSSHVPQWLAGDPLPLLLRAQSAVCLREELAKRDAESADGEVASLLEQMQVEVCLPFLNTKQQLIGFCLLGPRAAPSHGYSGEDLQLLGFLSRNAAIAWDNAMMYQDLQRSQALLRRTDRLQHLELMAGAYAHEVRNPLTSIKIFIELAPEKREDRGFIQEFSKVVTDDVTRIEKLTQEVLDLSNHTSPQFQEENLNAIVDSCVATLLLDSRDSRITVETDLEPTLPLVAVDRHQFKQALMNLLYNGREASEDHGSVLLVRTSLVLPGGRHLEGGLRLEVIDRGTGIPQDTLPHIFDPFFTTKPTRKGHHGTGLGLPIAKQIIQIHGGTLEVASEVGKGTTFTITLPMAVPPLVASVDKAMLSPSP